MFTRAHHSCLSGARLIQSMPSSSISLRSILILPSIYTGVFQVLSLRLPPQHPESTATLIHTCCMPHLSLLPLFGYLNSIYSFCSFLQLLPVRPRYLPQQPILAHYQAMLFPSCEKLIFMPT